jgi:hypothetical protein
MSSKKHYVKNADLYAAMVEYRKAVADASLVGRPKPRVPTYVGECIMKIATHLAYRPNFSNYTFRDEMISDGIENCLQYIDNFDPSKSQNPFAYFTQIIYYAFLRRIQKEKKYLYTKYVAIERANLLDETSEVQESDKRSGSRFNDDVSYGEWSQEQMERFMNSFDENRKSKKEKRKKAIDNDVTNSI